MIAVSARTMRELDSRAIRSGISAQSLMENAAEAVSAKAQKILASRGRRDASIFCGKGNNGGDGFAAGRKLKERGYEVRVYLYGKKSEVKNEAAVSLASFTGASGAVRELNSGADIERLKDELDRGVLIDALLGTGFAGPIRDPLKRLIEILNEASAPVISVDIPSGLDATTGKIDPVAIKAEWTISFGLPKKGFYEKDGAGYTGKIEIVNIGFPEDMLKNALEFEKKL